MSRIDMSEHVIEPNYQGRGRRIVVARIDLYNEHDVRIATGTGTYLIG